MTKTARDPKVWKFQPKTRYLLKKGKRSMGVVKLVDMKCLTFTIISIALLVALISDRTRTTVP